MRTLTSIQSADLVNASFEFQLTASDQSTTWIFDGNDIVSIGALSWEVPFGGGVGKTSNYPITLSTSLGFYKENYQTIVKAETNLKVTVNSDTFYPHVGRVRGLTRNGKDPNILELKVYDRFLDTNPLFPSSLQDSYSNLHPAVVTKDVGYPAYYGEHTRPIYLTPVDCDLKNLIGPLNVTSSNHTGRAWFNIDKSLPIDQASYMNVIRCHFEWNQQSGSNNLAVSSREFLVEDTGGADAKIFEFTGQDLQSNEGTISTSYRGRLHETFLEPSSSRYRAGSKVTAYRLQPRVGVYETRNLKGSVFVTANNSGTSHRINIQGENANLVWLLTGGNWKAGDIKTFNTSVNNPFLSGSENRLNYEFSYSASPFSGWVTTLSTSLEAIASLNSEEYKNYSVSVMQTTSSEIAVSENPVHILTHIFSEFIGMPFVQSQASESQIDVSSYKFQCGFYERQPMNKIIDEFGDITQTQIWIGDSGNLNFRTYQESSAVTINATVTTSDQIDFKIKDDPLGVSQYKTKKARRVVVQYGYDFGFGKYEQTNQSDFSNNTFCESANAAGIQTEVTKKSKYILDTDTASFWLGSVTRNSTQSESFVDMTLPARFFSLEVTDVVKIQNPMIVGSESLYQITKVTADYMKGEVKIQAQELLNG